MTCQFWDKWAASPHFCAFTLWRYNIFSPVTSPQPPDTKKEQKKILFFSAQIVTTKADTASAQCNRFLSKLQSAIRSEEAEKTLSILSNKTEMSSVG